MGFFPSGHNGPHLALETPVRNSCHLMLALLIGDKLSPDKPYRKCAKAILNWLLSSNIFFDGRSFMNRQRGGQDWSNGVIGHAWIIESLKRASDYLSNTEAGRLALDLYNHHKFNKDIGAWSRFDTYSNNFRVDYTLDHQAWFAASAIELGVKEHVEHFLDYCDGRAFRVTHEGRVRHLYYAKSIKSSILRTLYLYRTIRKPSCVDELEIGYHHYSLFPFCRIYSELRDHKFFKSDKFKLALSYIDSVWLDKLKGNIYSYPYNSPAFELPLIKSSFPDEVNITWKDLNDVYDYQVKMTCMPSKNFCNRNNPDNLTLTARIYELGLFIEKFLK